MFMVKRITKWTDELTMTEKSIFLEYLHLVDIIGVKPQLTITFWL